MSIAPSRPPALRDYPFWDASGQYYPPSDIGDYVIDELPGHLELPEENGEIVENFRETPQSGLLDQVVLPILVRLHPDFHFALGHDCGIYWKLTNPPERGAICPDWFYVPNVPPVLGRDYRRSYVLWKEKVPPAVMIEYASEDGEKERDRTPREGKFWIYENAVRGLYYAIFVVATGELEVHRLEDGHYRRLQPDVHGNYPIEPLGLALGVWHGLYVNETAPWLRWYDLQGNLMPLDAERAERLLEQFEEASQKAEAERQQREAEQLRADDLARQVDAERRRADEFAQQAAADRLLADEKSRLADEKSRLADEKSRLAEKLAEQLRALGIDPHQFPA